MKTEASLPPSRWIDLDGPVHYREWEGPASRTFVCVHGLGGSHLNWMVVAPALARHGRVLALDLAGFGLTPRHGRSASLPANRRLLSRFLAELAPARAVLVGNSMGGGIAILQAGVEPSSVGALVLTDPILPWSRGGRPAGLVMAVFGAYGIPGVGERFVAGRLRRLTAEELVEQSFRFIATDPRAIPPEVVRAHVELLEGRRLEEDTAPSFLEAARPLLDLGTRRRLIRRVLDRISCPVLLVHGERDRLVPAAFARAVARRYPEWQLEVMLEVGHAPMLEAGDRWLQLVEPWVSELPVTADAAPSSANSRHHSPAREGAASP
jgi:pimeloyl-ACP methyl ester carboxylesterase